MRKKILSPLGWDEELVERVIRHYESQSEEEAAAELTDEERAELDRRVREYEKNPNDGAAWPEVKDRILKRMTAT